MLFVPKLSDSSLALHQSIERSGSQKYSTYPMGMPPFFESLIISISWHIAS